MKRKSGPRGKSTSTAEVTNVSEHGLWLLVAKRELFVPFKEFPWFKNATIAALVNVKLYNGGHLHWPDLDVDLSIECVEHPKRFPLVDKRASPTKTRAAGARRKAKAPRRKHSTSRA
jgi:hypothetical protein